MAKIICFFICLTLLTAISPAFGADEIRLPCEVLEGSQSLSSRTADIHGIRYILLHHANAADRERLSEWLKKNSGTAVEFIVDGDPYRGILNRLPHCFGRGLLLHKGDVRNEKRDIIEVILPVASNN
jgi:hypothetical protein